MLELVAWLLTNMVAESVELRDEMLERGVLKVLISLVLSGHPVLLLVSLREDLCDTISSMIRVRPLP